MGYATASLLNDLGLYTHDAKFIFRRDDINKFLWMVRISQGVWPDEIKEEQISAL
jgi:hypothetical protein